MDADTDQTTGPAAGTTGRGGPGGAAPDSAAPDAASRAALERYAARMRPLRLIYGGVVGVIVIVLVVIVAVAYSTGEISHVTLRTVGSAPPSLTQQAPAATVTRAWSSTDATAVGEPYADGTVITYDRHTVRGRNASTGAETWSYTRTDRTVCSAIQGGGLTLAVYKLHGNCDEVTAVDTGTGDRAWTRTLDEDTAVFDGPASFAMQVSTQGDVFLFVSATSIYAISSNGVDWWRFHHAGCTINSAVAGPGGVLISQTCAGQDCNGAKFCGQGHQLMLRSLTGAYNDDSSTNANNPDQISWNLLGSTLVPVLAGNQIAARAASGTTLQLLDASTGKAGSRIALAPGAAVASSAAVSASDADLLWIGGRTYALTAGASSFAWQLDTSSVPTVSSASDDSTPTARNAVVLAPTAQGVDLIDGSTGAVTRSYAVGAVPAGGLVQPLGSGLLVAGSTTVAYR